MTAALTLKASVDSLQVVDAPSFKAGEALRATIRDAKKIELAPLDVEREERHGKWKAVCDKIAEVKTAYGNAENELKAKLFAYTEAQRIAAEKVAREAEAARRKAEEERIAEAAELADKGHEEAAEALLEIPVEAPHTPMPEPPLKVKGSRKYYSYEITDKEAFVRACLEKKLPVTLLCVTDDAKVLKPIVQSLKEGFSAPGVKVNSEVR